MNEEPAPRDESAPDPPIVISGVPVRPRRPMKPLSKRTWYAMIDPMNKHWEKLKLAYWNRYMKWNP